MKKLLAILLAVAMLVLCFAGCGAAGGEEKSDLKVGFIFLHDEQSTYDKNFMDAAKAACEAMNVDYAQRLRFLNPRTAMMQLLNLLRLTVVTSSSQTALVTNPSLSMLLRSILMYSSAMQPVLRLTLQALRTSTMLSLLSTRVVTSQVLQQV